jgi:PAS domain S-box-containing protein
MLESGTVEVLYVEDDPQFAEVTSTTIERRNERFCLEIANSAGEALTKLAESTPDCIVSDYEMPGQNGIELLKQVRDRYTELPFILYTGRGSETIASEAIRAGVTDYLQKGTGTEQYDLLANRIRNAVERYQATQELNEVRQRYDSLRTELLEISIDLLQPGQTNITSCINDCLERIGYRIGAQRGHVFQPDEDGTMMTSRYSWSTDAVSSQPEPTQSVSTTTDLPWLDELRDGETVLLRDPARFVETGAVTDSAEADSLLVLAPMLSDDELAGFIRFDLVSDYEWRSRKLLYPLKIVGQIINAAVQRQSRQEELKRRERYIEQSTDVISVTDQHGEILYQSRSAGQSDSFTPSEILGQSKSEHIHPDDVEKTTPRFKEFAAQPGAEIREELRVRSKSESWRWIEVQGVNKLDDPLINGLLFSSRDISERRRRERQFEALVGNSNDIISITDDDGVHQYLSPAFEDVLERECETAIGESMLSYIHPDDQDRVRATLERSSRSNGEGFVVKYRAEHADGSYRWMESRGSDHSDTAGIEGYLINSRDITAQREREQRIHRYNDTLEQLYETTQNLIEVTSKQQVARQVIAGFETVFESELAGVWLFDSEEQSLQPAALSERGRELVSDPPVYTPNKESLSWNVYRDGETRYINDVHAHENRANPATKIRSEVIASLGEDGLLNVGSTDPDGFDDWERNLIEVWANTATVVLKRVAEFEELQAQKRKLSHERDRLDDFTSILSHDIQNPLNVALLRTDLASRECDSEHLSTAVQALSRIEELTDSLLTLTKHGQTVEETSVVQLDTMASQSWDTIVTEEASLRAVTTERVRANQSRVHRLFENLFRNAVEHNNTDVTVTVGLVEDGSGFYVADDGAGIPESKRSELFERGFTTSEHGIGLGLQIVKRICEAHGWEVTVAESTDGGARFEITNVEFVE